MSALPFVEFDKIPRLNRPVVVTEKIDGTNAQVYVRPAIILEKAEFPYDTTVELGGKPFFVRAGSRNRWLPACGTDDNSGFGRWVHANAGELAKLGPGAHFGEWWGQGIQRKYGLTEKRFSLFNVGRWLDGDGKSLAPEVCHVVPVLMIYTGIDEAVKDSLTMLRTQGSMAAPGFMDPEGIVVYHTAARSLFKVTLEKDEVPKALAHLRGFDLALAA